MRTNYTVVSVFLWKAWSFVKWSPSQETDCQILHHMEHRKKSRNKNFAKGNLPKVTMTCIVDFSRKILHPTFCAVNSERDGLKMEGGK